MLGYTQLTSWPLRLHVESHFYREEPVTDHDFSHGVQGKLDRASKLQLENEFGTKNAEDAVKAVLEKGTVQETKSEAKQGGRNDSNAAGAGVPY
jgi:hypothetical protein